MNKIFLQVYKSKMAKSYKKGKIVSTAIREHFGSFAAFEKRGAKNFPLLPGIAFKLFRLL